MGVKDEVRGQGSGARSQGSEVQLQPHPALRPVEYLFKESVREAGVVL